MNTVTIPNSSTLDLRLNMTMASRTSSRSAATLARLNEPWMFAAKHTYNADTNPEGTISFALAENKLVIEDIQKQVNSKADFDTEQFTYGWCTGGGTVFPSLLATHLNEYLQPYEPILSEQIKATGACTALHDMLSWAIAEEGDGILVSRPVYGRFELDFTNRSGVKVVYADTDAENCFDEDVVDKYERAIVESAAAGVAVKAILIVNPNNPLGKCYPRSTLINIMKLCQKHQIHLISDEIYACSVFESGETDATPFTSALSINPAGIIDPELLHIEYGFSKDFGSGGLKIGAIVSRNQPVLEALNALMRFHNPSGAALAVANALIGDRQWCRSYIESMRGKLAAAYKLATSGLEDIGIKYLRGSNAGFFVWINLSQYLPTDLDGEANPEFALAKKLKDAGVFLHPKEEHSSTPGWFRFVYTHHPETVREGLRRIKNVLGQLR